jgi:hypothetical protein
MSDTNDTNPPNDQPPADPIQEAMENARAQGIPILVDLGDDRVILIVPAHTNPETARQIVRWMFGLKPKISLLPPVEDTQEQADDNDTTDETQ